MSEAFDVLHEIERRLSALKEISSPIESVKLGDKIVGKVTFDKTKKIYTISRQAKLDYEEVSKNIDELFREATKNSENPEKDVREIKIRAQNLLLLTDTSEKLLSSYVRSEIRDHFSAELYIRNTWEVVVPSLTIKVPGYLPPGHSSSGGH